VIEIDLQRLRGHLGEELAVSDWIEVTQARIDQFAAATGDRQWIHVDPERAALESPFETTIAHGFLTLSLVSALARSAISTRARMAINYGVNRVRFITPVPAGSRLRGRFVPKLVEEEKGALQVTWSVTLEREGQTRPCCVAEWLVRYHLADSR
jgi:acyl dehydratase